MSACASTCAIVGIAGALATSTVRADPDLVVHREPVKLAMRPKRIAAQPQPTTPAPPPPAGLDPIATVAAPAHVLPERVTVHVRAGYELDAAPASGRSVVGGNSLPTQFAGSRSWLVGDAMVNARDVVLPSLGGYLLSSFQYDTGSAAASRTALPVPGDATDQRLAIKAGYAEYRADDKDPDHHLWLRAGRQYRLDAGAMFAYFDGATIGWKEPAWNVSAFAGRRVALYVDTPTGFELGATAALDVSRLGAVRIKLAADVMAMSIAGQLRSLAVLGASYDPSREVQVDVRARAINGGTGLGFGRADARVRWTPRRDLVVIDRRRATQWRRRRVRSRGAVGGRRRVGRAEARRRARRTDRCDHARRTRRVPQRPARADGVRARRASRGHDDERRSGGLARARRGVRDAARRHLDDGAVQGASVHPRRYRERGGDAVRRHGRIGHDTHARARGRLDVAAEHGGRAALAVWRRPVLPALRSSSRPICGSPTTAGSAAARRSSGGTRAGFTSRSPPMSRKPIRCSSASSAR